MKRTPISIGIAAYNAERNIVPILQSLISQKEEGFMLQEIIVHSDCSTDNTVSLVQSMNNDKVRVIDNKQRKGFAGSAISIIKDFTGDILVLLNDDIRITDMNVLSKIIKPFSEEGVGLVGGNVQPLNPRTFIERATVSIFRAYERMRLSIPNKNNQFTYDGAFMALSKKFAKSISFPSDMSQMGNFDSFLYAYSVLKGIGYRYVADAIAYVRMPSTIKDYIRRSTRDNTQHLILGSEFKNIVDDIFKKPFWLSLKCIFIEFTKNPLEIVFISMLGIYVRIEIILSKQNIANPMWEIVESSKYLEI